MNRPQSGDLYKGSIFATREEVKKDAGENGEVLEAPDPADFYMQGVSGEASQEVQDLYNLAKLAVQMYDRMREIRPESSDDEIRNRMLPMPCGKLAQLNETLFAFCTSRELVSKRESIFKTLLVRARLETGELDPNAAKLELSTLMGMTAASRQRLKAELMKTQEAPP